MSGTFEVFVPGIPRPQGSKSAFPIRRPNGKMGATVVDSSGKLGKAWRKTLDAHIRQAWRREHGPAFQLTEPVRADITFQMPRPKAHYGTGRNAGKLKPWAAHKRHTSPPDALKLARAVEDAMTKLVYTDDALIDDGRQRKLYHATPGVLVRLVW